MNPSSLVWGIFCSVGRWVCDHLSRAFISTVSCCLTRVFSILHLRRVCCLQRDLEEAEGTKVLVLCKSKDKKSEWPLSSPFPRRKGVRETQTLTSFPKQQGHWLSTFPLWGHASRGTNRQEGNHNLSWGSAEAASLGPLDVEIDERGEEDGRNWQVSLGVSKKYF